MNGKAAGQRSAGAAAAGHGSCTLPYTGGKISHTRDSHICWMPHSRSVIASLLTRCLCARKTCALISRLICPATPSETSEEYVESRDILATLSPEVVQKISHEDTGASQTIIQLHVEIFVWARAVFRCSVLGPARTLPGMGADVCADREKGWVDVRGGGKGRRSRPSACPSVVRE